MGFKSRMLKAGPIWRRLVERSDSHIRLTAIAGGAAGTHSVTGIKKGDKLISVLYVDFTDASETCADRTSEFIGLGGKKGNGIIITVDGQIDDTGGTASTGGFLVVCWEAYDER